MISAADYTPDVSNTVNLIAERSEEAGVGANGGEVSVEFV